MDQWDIISQSFIKSELNKEAPGFRILSEKIQTLSDKEKHGVWMRLGEAFRNRYWSNNSDIDKRRAVQCYIEALFNRPDATMVVAWDGLELLGAKSSSTERSRDTIQLLRMQYGSITQEG